MRRALSRSIRRCRGGYPCEQRSMRLTLNYRTRIIASLSEVGEPAWNGLLALQADANPFLSYAFLHALHESGSASRKSMLKFGTYLPVRASIARTRPSLRNTSRRSEPSALCQ